jgi:hypothetical protein
MSANNRKTIEMYEIEALNKCENKMFCSKGHNIYDTEECCSWCGESKKYDKKDKKIIDLIHKLKRLEKETEGKWFISEKSINQLLHNQ